MGRFEDFFNALAEACEEHNKNQEEKKAELRKEFEDNSERKIFNRGTVIAAMAEQGWSSYKMDSVLEKVTNSEKAEAAVGLIKTGKYDYWDVCIILESF